MSSASDPSKYVSLNDIAHYIFTQVNHTESRCRETTWSFRATFLRDYVWKKVGEDNGLYKTPKDIPFYYLYDKYQMQVLGTIEEEANRWISAYLKPKIKHSNQDTMPILPIFPHVETKKTFFSSYDDFAFVLRQLDRKERLRHHFEHTMTVLHGSCPITRFLALDIEAYEFAQRKLTEIGVAIYDRPRRCFSHHHILIREHVKLKNKRFAPSAKHAFHYGQSQVMGTREAMAWLETNLRLPGTALLGHSLICDLRYLQRAILPGHSSSGSKLGERIHAEFLEQLPKYDLQYLYRCRGASDRAHNLEYICKELEIPITMKLHNAGNDAALTLKAFLKLMNLEPNK